MKRPVACRDPLTPRRPGQCIATPRRPLVCGCTAIPAAGLSIAAGPMCGGQARPSLVRTSIVVPVGRFIWIRWRCALAAGSAFRVYGGNATGPVGAPAFEFFGGAGSAPAACSTFTFYKSWMFAIATARLWMELETLSGANDGPGVSAQIIECVDLTDVNGLVPGSVGRVIYCPSSRWPGVFPSPDLICGPAGYSEDSWPLVVQRSAEQGGTDGTLFAQGTGLVPSGWVFQIYLAQIGGAPSGVNFLTGTGTNTTCGTSVRSGAVNHFMDNSNLAGGNRNIIGLNWRGTQLVPGMQMTLTQARWTPS